MIKLQPLDGKLFSRNKPVLWFWLALFIMSLVSVLSSNHGYLNIFFNQHYNPTLGSFFKYYTKLGEETLLVPIALLLIVMVRKWEFVLRLSASMLVNSILSSFLKFIVFSTERPKLALEKFNLIFTEGIHVHQYNSFPSGHTSAAFAFAFALAFWFNQKYIGVILIILACLVGLSRIYLQQHFLEDVIGGSFIGLVSAIIALFFTLSPRIK